MKIPIGNYLFDGPLMIEELENKRGLFAVICKKDKYYLLDVGVANELRKALENHVRRDCWEESKIGDIMYATYYIDEMHDNELVALEKDIRETFTNIPCGGT